MVIQLVALEHSSHGDAGCPRQSHATVATVEVTSDGNGWVKEHEIVHSSSKKIMGWETINWSVFNTIVLFHFRYMLKPLKQKLFVDGLSYLLQEIYGLENKVALFFIQVF